MLKCRFCGADLSWESDYDSDDVGYPYNGVVSMYTCRNADCGAEYEIFLPNKKAVDNDSKGT